MPTTTVKDEIKRLLHCIAFAIQATSSSFAKYLAAGVIFGTDMIVHQDALVKWNVMREQKKNQQIKDNKNKI